MNPGLSEEVKIIVAGYHNDNTNYFVQYNPFDKLCWLRRLIEVYIIDKNMDVDDEFRMTNEKQSNVQKWIQTRMEESGQDLAKALQVTKTVLRIIVTLAMDLTESAYVWGKKICSTDVSNLV